MVGGAAETGGEPTSRKQRTRRTGLLTVTKNPPGIWGGVAFLKAEFHLTTHVLATRKSRNLSFNVPIASCIVDDLVLVAEQMNACILAYFRCSF